MESGSQFFLKYKNKLTTSIGDNHFKKPIEFIYIIQEQLDNNKY